MQYDCQISINGCILRMTSFRKLWLIAILVCTGTAANAQTVFKCKLPDGSFSYQAQRCPDSASQQTLTTNRTGAISIAPSESSGTARSKPLPSEAAHVSAPHAVVSPAPGGAEAPRSASQDAATASPETVAAVSTLKEPLGSAKQGFLMLFLVVFGLLSIFGILGLYIAAFRESLGWGLICLFVPFGMFVFVITHWQETKLSFLISMAVPVFGICAAVFMGRNSPPAKKDAQHTMIRNDCYSAKAMLA